MNLSTYTTRNNMKNTYNILAIDADAQNNIKVLNDYLVELGTEVIERSVRFDDLEKLMNNPEFMRLMTNVRFFAEEGNKYMAEVYGNLAKFHEHKAVAVQI
jgi:uncharacterized secreted protein with C-terminal beta-propeller domain